MIPLLCVVALHAGTAAWAGRRRETLRPTARPARRTGGSATLTRPSALRGCPLLLSFVAWLPARGSDADIPPRERQRVTPRVGGRLLPGPTGLSMTWLSSSRLLANLDLIEGGCSRTSGRCARTCPPARSPFPSRTRWRRRPSARRAPLPHGADAIKLLLDLVPPSEQVRAPSQGASASSRPTVRQESASHG